MQLDEEHRKIIDLAVKQIQERYPEVLAIYVFGSFGTEYETNESDLDLEPVYNL